MDIQLPEVSILRFVTSVIKQGKSVNFMKKKFRKESPD